MPLKLGLFIRTVQGLMPCQIMSRFRRIAGFETPLVGAAVNKVVVGSLSRLPMVPELDFDPAFLARFDCDEILNDRVTLLHHVENINWEHSWSDPHASHLWSFNFHYHEYLLPLLKMTLEGGETRYIEKAKSIVRSWIAFCPRSAGGDAWHPYTISVRTANWLAFVAEGGNLVTSDAGFMRELNASLAEQYAHLSRHLETDLLANHYFENLKALTLMAVYFEDEPVLDLSLGLLEEQIDEQILADGMHFELSPMYHKVVLEGLLRVLSALGTVGVRRQKLEDTARKMCDAMFSMERDTCRTPLFNDSGDNVAKSCGALLSCAKRLLGHEPVASLDLSASGYHIIERDCPVGKVKLIFDAGMPGPRYASGHAHCDALSFELFIDGAPVIVNSGTYAYQDPLRQWFRGSAAHNGVWRDGVEQSEMWGEHRMARGASVRFLIRKRSEDYEELSAELVDYLHGKIIRTIRLTDDSLLITDRETEGDLPLCSILRFPSKAGCDPYAPEFGRLESAERFDLKSNAGEQRFIVSLHSLPSNDSVNVLIGCEKS